MYILTSDTIGIKLNIIDDILYVSEISNELSNMSFVPDGGSSCFEIKFADGDLISSKNLKVTEHTQEGNQLIFKFASQFNTSVILNYKISANNKIIEKQLHISQSESKKIDYIILENVGIINSVSSFSVPDIDNDDIYKNLGQPFYIDSLFWGCEFPATRNGIFNGRGQIKYYIGKDAINPISCPTTIIGGAKSTLNVDLRSSFFEYIESISQNGSLQVNYNPWFDCKMDINSDKIQNLFLSVSERLSSNDTNPIDCYVIDDGWNNYNNSFWNIDRNKFPNGLSEISNFASKLGSGFGLWISPRGGYDYNSKFAKKIEKARMGYINAEDSDICIASKNYMEHLGEFIIEQTEENDISYWKFDGFCKKPCQNSKHDHITGGEKNMYYITEMWHGYIEIFRKLREFRSGQGKPLFINLTCYVNPSPWLLQYVNTIWLQQEYDISFAENYSKDKQSKLDAMLTYRDSGYFDFLSRRAYQIPSSAIFNHDPIYAKEVDLSLDDKEFEKLLYWNACRGSSLLELYLSVDIMNNEKWQILSKVIDWQRKNFSILKNAMFIGGDPADNNIYCYASWDNTGSGIIGLRNPSNEKTALTLTLNKLMGCPESLTNIDSTIIYDINHSNESMGTYNYNDKIDLELAPFEVKIIQFNS